jgi:hypothetical protein
MPGANCSIFGCSTSRKSKGVAIFRVPTADDEYSTEWRNKIVSIITRDREIDKGLRKQIKGKTLHTCELHYAEETLLRNQRKTTRIPGSLPTLNLPVKSFQTQKCERSTASIEKRATLPTSTASSSATQSNSVYRTIAEFIKRIQKLKLPSGWEIKDKVNFTSIYIMDNVHVVPKIEILVQESLHFNVLVYNWNVPKNNNSLSNYNSSMENITLSALISEILSKDICQGVNFNSRNHIVHAVPKLFTVSRAPFFQTKFNRPQKCLILCDLEKCKVCSDAEKLNLKQGKIRLEKEMELIKLNAPLSLTSPERLKAAVSY